jgi:hypothetical protein
MPLLLQQYRAEPELNLADLVVGSDCRSLATNFICIGRNQNTFVVLAQLIA